MRPKVFAEREAWRTYKTVCAGEMRAQGRTGTGWIAPTAATVAAYEAWRAAYRERHGIRARTKPPLGSGA